MNRHNNYEMSDDIIEMFDDITVISQAYCEQHDIVSIHALDDDNNIIFYHSSSRLLAQVDDIVCRNTLMGVVTTIWPQTRRIIFEHSAGNYEEIKL